MNRDLTNRIRYVMDEWLPPVIRDSRWFMRPLYMVAYRTWNVRDVMDFKRRVWSFTAEEYARFYQSLDSISRNRATDLNKPTLDFILDHIDPEARTLIDVGSGNGYLLRQIHARRPDLELTGLDVADRDDATCYEAVRGNVERLPYADKAFDVVTCSHTIEHLPRLEQCVRELTRVARRQVFIVTPCQRYFYYTLDEHVNFFPYEAALTSRIPLADYTCRKMNGDWVYLGRVPHGEQERPLRLGAADDSDEPAQLETR